MSDDKIAEVEQLRADNERLRGALRDIERGDYSDPMCERTPEQRARVAYRITCAAGQAIVRRALEDMEIIDNVSEAEAA